ncbi:MAG: segregation/condensation protein A [Candidatus Omnitrophica bacterium]|nr:segregation/condensation protein A [Candidatus Omnitrophota bacterium]
MTYKVKLEIFEGPLDLLLYLIRRDELNIHDIPISNITNQYVQYLDLMRMLDLDIAGEFLVMAATLMHIKSKLLLPPDETQEAEEEQDPRAELVGKLLEYKKFKEAARQLQNMESKQKEVFTNPGSREIAPDAPDDDLYFEANIFDLLTAFSKILKEVPKEKFYEVVKDEVTVSEKIHEIFHLLVKRPTIYFLELFHKVRSKIEIIATFLALLELIRMKEVLVKQDKVFSDIKIVRNSQRMTAPKIQEGEYDRPQDKDSTENKQQ